MSRQKMIVSGFLAVSVALVLLAGTAPAGIIIDHVGTTDPVTEGWNHLPSGTTTEGASGDGQAWAMTTTKKNGYYIISGSTDWAAYEAALNDPTGWTFTSTVKLQLAADVNDCQSARMWDPTHGDLWALHLVDGSGTKAAGMWALHTTGAVQIHAMDPTAGYNTYQMVYDPAGDSGSGLLTYYLNGGSVGTLTRGQAEDAPGGPGGDYMGFADWESAAGTSSSHDWKLVQFETGQHPVPEPTTLVLLVTGIVGLLAYAWRKRRS